MKKQTRQQVHDKYGGKCAYCGNPSGQDWQVDHMISQCYFKNVIQKGDPHHIDDLMPACRKCNHYKREMGIESTGYIVGFRDYMKTFHIRLGKLPKKTAVRRTEERIKYMQDIASRYGITSDMPFSGVFYFEKLHISPAPMSETNNIAP